MTTKTLSKSDLAHFTGSESWYRHAINRNVLLHCQGLKKKRDKSAFVFCNRAQQATMGAWSSVRLPTEGRRRCLQNGGETKNDTQLLPSSPVMENSFGSSPFCTHPVTVLE